MSRIPAQTSSNKGNELLFSQIGGQEDESSGEESEDGRRQQKQYTEGLEEKTGIQK